MRDECRGRVYGSLAASGALLSLAGAMTGGALAEVVGIVPMLNVAVALIVLSALVVFRAFARGRPVESDGGEREPLPPAIEELETPRAPT